MINIGDLVKFSPRKVSTGALTAIKYITRMESKINGQIGVVIENHGTNVSVTFGDKILIMNKQHLEVVNEKR